MSDSTRESYFMPSITRLPEGLQELEFKGRFENLDSASYARVNREIETRIALCEVYR